MRVMVAVVALAVAGAGNIGCASILTGTTQDVQITSEPPGRRVLVDGHEAGVTPVKVAMKRGDTHSIAVEGFESQTTSTSFNGWTLANIIFGGVFGLIIDIASGASEWISPDFYHFGPAVPEAPPVAEDGGK